jgi:hypothetical protein
VTPQDRQAIDDLFQHLNQSATQPGPRDHEADARIRQHIQAGPPWLLYEMAQRLVGQQAALRQLRTQLSDCQQQLRQGGGAPAGFARQGYRGNEPPYPQPQQYPQQYQRAGNQGQGQGGFLAGAGQIALGVGGGILAAEALGSLFDGGGLFGGGRDEYVEQNVYVDQDNDNQNDNDNSQNDSESDYDDSGDYDSGGDFADGGGFDGGDW